MAKTIDANKLKEVVNNLDPANDYHWNMTGGPDMNHIKEAAGTAVSRKLLGEHGFGDLTRDNVSLYQDAMNDVHLTDAEAPAVPEVVGDPDPDVPDEAEPEAEPEVAPAEPEAEDVQLSASLETGEPTLSDLDVGAIIGNPEASSPEDAGAAIIKVMDRLGVMMSPEVRRRQGELGDVFQLYQANRPTIIERQKRLAQRQANQAQALKDAT